MTKLDDLPQPIQDLYPADVRSHYEIHDWRIATVVFHGAGDRMG